MKYCNDDYRADSDGPWERRNPQSLSYEKQIVNLYHES